MRSSSICFWPSRLPIISQARFPLLKNILFVVHQDCMSLSIYIFPSVKFLATILLVMNTCTHLKHLKKSWTSFCWSVLEKTVQGIYYLPLSIRDFHMHNTSDYADVIWSHSNSYNWVIYIELSSFMDQNETLYTAALPIASFASTSFV